MWVNLMGELPFYEGKPSELSNFAGQTLASELEKEISKQEIARLTEENEKLRDEISHRDVFVKLSEESNHLQKIALLAVVEKENERLKAENEKLKHQVKNITQEFCRLEDFNNQLKAEMAELKSYSNLFMYSADCKYCKNHIAVLNRFMKEIKSLKNENEALKAQPSPEYCAVSGAKLDTHKLHRR
jgi:cell division protein FtsB